MFLSVLAFYHFLWPYPLKKVKFRKSLLAWLVLDLCIFAVLVNLVLLASPPFWFLIWLSQKKEPCAGHMTSTWPRWLPRKSHLEKFKFTIFVVKCIFGTSATGTDLSLSRLLVNQVKGIYCLKKSIDFLRHCSCLLGKVNGKSFKCKLTEFVS